MSFALIFIFEERIYAFQIHLYCSSIDHYVSTSGEQLLTKENLATFVDLMN